MSISAWIVGAIAGYALMRWAMSLTVNVWRVEQSAAWATFRVCSWAAMVVFTFSCLRLAVRYLP